METIKLTSKVKTVKKSAPKGYILYKGQSNIDGSNIVAILTLKTANVKTGQMAQLWILNSDLDPVSTSKAGLDVGVCGQCKLRQSLGGACYVNLGQAPLQVYKSYKKGIYSYLPLSDYSALNGLKIRFGAYGDPFAIPSNILDKLSEVSLKNTSYTHQWKLGDDTLKAVSMASVDNIEEQITATANGWRTFRVSKVENDTLELMDNEIICPNYTNGITCADCGLCGGANVKAKNIVIPVHGNRKNKF